MPDDIRIEAVTVQSAIPAETWEALERMQASIASLGTAAREAARNMSETAERAFLFGEHFPRGAPMSSVVADSIQAMHSPATASGPAPEAEFYAALRLTSSC